MDVIRIALTDLTSFICYTSDVILLMVWTMIVLVSLKNINDAQLICNALKGQGIRSHAEEFEGRYQVVLSDEQDLNEASQLISHYLVFDSDIEAEQKLNPGSLSWNNLSASWFCVVVCVIELVIYLLANAGWHETLFSYLSFPSTAELSEGFNAWRFVTPVFLHFSVMHIVFNLLWWWQWGTLVERSHSSFRLMSIFIFTALASNGMQYLLVGPNFGGLSGVVYGLLGYLWMYKKYIPSSTVYVHPNILRAMLIWMLLGFSGLLTVVIGPMANWAHAFGLIMGCVLGWAYAYIDKAHDQNV